LGIGKDSVARIWRDHELEAWKVDRFKEGPRQISTRVVF
jgi:hypothetical protein